MVAERHLNQNTYNSARDKAQEQKIAIQAMGLQYDHDQKEQIDKSSSFFQAKNGKRAISDLHLNKT